MEEQRRKSLVQVIANLGESWYGVVFSRHVSRPAAEWLARRVRVITPNAVTWVMVGCNATAAVLWSRWYVPAAFWWGFALINAALILDALDGDLARAKQQYSLRGIYLDLLNHYLVEPPLFFAIALGVCRVQGTVATGALVAATAALMGRIGWHFARDGAASLLYEVLTKDSAHHSRGQEAEATPKLATRARTYWGGSNLKAAIWAAGRLAIDPASQFLILSGALGYALAKGEYELVTWALGLCAATNWLATLGQAWSASMVLKEANERRRATATRGEDGGGAE